VLIDSPRLTDADRAAWARFERYDTALGPRAEARAPEALAIVRAFAASGPCYCGVSWGKDSVVVAHLVTRLAEAGGPIIPLVWVRVEPLANPDCELVRDAFLERFTGYPYEEIAVRCPRGPIRQSLWLCEGANGAGWLPKGTLEEGFALAVERYGDRYVSGIRAEESGGRKRRMRAFGESTSRTCAPIGWWTGPEIFAYLHHHQLPTHPAYAMSLGGRLDRIRIRVASLGICRGSGVGKLEWEMRYYSDCVQKLQAG
jgi:phosphoadenosine phosphosulfate reductase